MIDFTSFSNGYGILESQLMEPQCILGKTSRDIFFEIIEKLNASKIKRLSDIDDSYI